MKRLDFGGLNRHLLQRAEELLSDWFPQGKLRGREYCVGNLGGSSGDSLKINIDTGKWADFASDVRGLDLISLYAKLNNYKNSKAAERLASRYSFNVDSEPARPKEPSNKALQIKALPSLQVLPDRVLQGQHWKYFDEDGLLLFVISRQDVIENGKPKKIFTPWVWANSKPICKQWPEPRPLYNLHKLKDNKPIIITEGEKACDAAEAICGRIYTCVSWAGGSNAYHKTDWKPLHGRRVLMWPDADDAGMKAAKAIEKLLAAHCTSFKVIDSVFGGKSNGWDAHDGKSEGMTLKTWKQWAAPIAKLSTESTLLNKRVEEKIQPSIVDRMPEPIPPPPEVQIYMDSDDAPAVPYVSDEMKTKWHKIGLSLNATATSPHLNVANAKKVIEYKFAKSIWYDEFHNKYLTTWNTKAPREWTDHDSLMMAELLQTKWGFTRISDELCFKAIQLFAMANKRNEPRDWLGSIEWDNKPRISRFFDRALGSLESEYAAAASRNWWISMVARVFQPGCKVDNMVILEGRQGSFKSTALSLVGGPWYAEITGDITNKDFYQALQGKILVEIGELDSFNKHEVTTIKKVVSTAVDRYRAPYARQPQDYPRQCVFVGTTNEKHYLRDSTGARRFWPVATTKIDVKYIQKNREQMFAEAVSLYKAKASWHKMPASALEEQESRREWDEWEGVISEWLAKNDKTETTVAEVARYALDMDMERINRQSQNRIAKVLRILDWESGKQKKLGGKTVRPWYPSEDAAPGKGYQNSSNNVHSAIDVPNLAPYQH